MDFRFSPEDEAFRAEVREFIRQSWPAHLVRRGVEDGFDPELLGEVKALRKKLAERNWIAIAWPKEYGGMGASHIRQAIFKEEMGYGHCPGIDPQAYQIGPALIHYGTEEQKRQHLGGIARAEVFWCQGFSEPDAGSDLASLKTSAVQNGDEFVINGQKIWTSGAHVSDYIHLLARTDPKAPKHKGISYFIFSMRLPGIRVEPIHQVDGGHGFNTVFFDNVRVSKEALLGPLNQGWYVAMTTLNYERANISGAAAAQHNLEDLVQYCKETRANGRRLADNPLVRHRLVESAIELEVAKLLSYRVLWLQDKGEVPETESSISKNVTYDVVARLAVRGIEILGLRGQLGIGDAGAPLGGRFNWAYLRTACRAGGGTPEIQRNIIATRGLGLPR